MTRDVDIETRYRNGETLQKIGDSYGISRERVRQILARKGITKDDGGKTVEMRKRVDVEKIKELRSEGFNATDIYDILGVAGAVVRKYIKIAEVPKWDGKKRQCQKCGIVDDISNFYRVKSGGYVVYLHKPCRNEYMKQWHKGRK